MADRKVISKKTRFDVFKRDLFTCQYCGAHPPKVILNVDHINPVSEGGQNNRDNLITSCEPCNSGKGARLLSDVPQSLKNKAQDVAESELQIKGYNAVMQSKVARINNEAWGVAALLEGKDWIETYNPANLLSIKRFLELLPFHEVMSAAEITGSKRLYSDIKKFKYFCAICWNKIRDQNNG